MESQILSGPEPGLVLQLLGPRQQGLPAGCGGSYWMHHVARNVVHLRLCPLFQKRSDLHHDHPLRLLDSFCVFEIS